MEIYIEIGIHIHIQMEIEFKFEIDVDEFVQGIADAFVDESFDGFVNEIELRMLIMKFRVINAAEGCHAAVELILHCAAVSSVITVAPCDDAAIAFESCERVL